MNVLEKLENKYLLVPKILQLIICLQYYTLHNLRHLFASDKFQVSTTSYAEYISYIQCATFFTNIFWGQLSDRTGYHRKLLVGLILATCGIFSLFYLDDYYNSNVWVFWGILLAYQFFNMPKQPLLDKIILDYLTESPAASPESYGRQRAWGTVAYTLATFIAEKLVKTYDGEIYHYSWNGLLVYSFLFTGLATMCLLFLVRTKENTRNTGHPTGYMELVRNKEFMFFILIMFLNAITRQAMSNYLGNFFVRVLCIKPYDLPKTWPSFVTNFLEQFNQNYISTFATFGTFFEILAMYFSESIIKTLGYFFPLLIAQMISLVRFYAYYVVNKEGENVFGICCLIELVKGLYFGLAHISGFAIATKLAPSYLSVTAQMMFQGVFTVLGSLVSGKVFSLIFGATLNKKKDDPVDAAEIASFENLFCLNIIICIFTITLFVIKYGIVDKVLFDRQKEKEKLEFQEAHEKEKLEFHEAQENIAASCQ